MYAYELHAYKYTVARNACIIECKRWEKLKQRKKNDGRAPDERVGAAGAPTSTSRTLATAALMAVMTPECLHSLRDGAAVTARHAQVLLGELLLT